MVTGSDDKEKTQCSQLVPGAGSFSLSPLLIYINIYINSIQAQ